MPKTPVLSVCIPNFNMVEWVGSAVRSGLSQLQAEVVVVDNASSDGSKELLSALPGDNRLRVYLETEHVSSIRNLARSVERASGEWVVVLSADDELLARFSTQLLTELHSGYDIINQAAVVSDRPTTWVFGTDKRREVFVEECIASNPFCLATTAFRKTSYHLVGGFNPEAKELADWDLWLNIVGNGGTALALPQLGGIYEMHRGSTWSRMVNTEFEIEARLAMLSARVSEWESWGILDQSRSEFAKRSLEIGQRLTKHEPTSALRSFQLGAIHGGGEYSRQCSEWSDASKWPRLTAGVRLRRLHRKLRTLTNPQYILPRISHYWD